MHCKREHLDQLFVAVNVQLVQGAGVQGAAVQRAGVQGRGVQGAAELEEPGANPKKLLNRREWVDAIIRMAIMRHQMGGPGDASDASSDASDALHLFLSTLKTDGHLPPYALTDGTAFRTACCYTEPVDAVLGKCDVSPTSESSA